MIVAVKVHDFELTNSSEGSQSKKSSNKKVMRILTVSANKFESFATHEPVTLSSRVAKFTC